MLTRKENREKYCADENISKRIFIMMTARRLRRAVSVASVKTKYLVAHEKPKYLASDSLEHGASSTVEDEENTMRGYPKI